ncbi:peroxiredoxin, OsmC subfamily [Halodesulfurarchaeum formicicum]|uniref:Peroxiredoxin, OsmC subfamily n=1 Tax=Halodesulfurarchaeum formicicum TaxID=1873524 RepID=A0A1D8S5P9_9EURY|nr:OsmC family protein [Halodesulfurarchaeum formicicum]AOW80679.1 peroxiredoxin, OsmC subfamily [Halodesulfurarchaeum formicicum]
MPVRNATATWEGTLKEGAGSMALGSGAFEGTYSFDSRFADGNGTNPEELIGAAHAGCFSMALANALAEDGYDPQRVHTEAAVSLNADSLEIDHIELTLDAQVPDIEVETFETYAADAKANCPVSKALAGVDITLSTTLE